MEKGKSHFLDPWPPCVYGGQMSGDARSLPFILLARCVPYFLPFILRLLVTTLMLLKAMAIPAYMGSSMIPHRG